MILTMNHNWRRLIIELTIVLNLEDLLKPIELDQKPWNGHTKCV
jgi:hypothetical protein